LLPDKNRKGVKKKGLRRGKAKIKIRQKYLISGTEPKKLK